MDILIKFNVKMRRIFARYFSNITLFVYSLKFKFFDFDDKPPLIILTPGKVGSSSVCNTLKKKLNNYSVFHIHYLSDQGIQQSIETHMNSDRKSKPLHLIISKLLNKKLRSFQATLNIITITREPISRTISSFFQNIDLFRDSIEDSNLQIDKLKSMEIIKKQIKESVSHLNY